MIKKNTNYMKNCVLINFKYQDDNRLLIHKIEIKNYKNRYLNKEK